MSTEKIIIDVIIFIINILLAIIKRFLQKMKSNYFYDLLIIQCYEFLLFNILRKLPFF